LYAVLSPSRVKYYTCTQNISGLSHKQCTSILVPSKLLQICVCYTYILYVKKLSLWWNKGLRNIISHYSIMLVHLSIAFTENCVYWTYNICGLNHQYPITTLGFTSFYNNVLNYVHSISPFNDSSYNFLIGHLHRLVSNYK
jgi:hypothetical protein